MSDPRLKSARVNALYWGTVVAVVAAVIVLVTPTPSTNPLLSDPLRAAGVGFFFGWAAGELRNWFGRKLP